MTELRRYVLAKADRMRSARSGARRLFAGLALCGAVGWMIVLPTIGGAFAGRWLDARYGTGVSMTLGLLLLGLVSGGYSVWRLLVRESK